MTRRLVQTAARGVYDPAAEDRQRRRVVEEEDDDAFLTRREEAFRAAPPDEQAYRALEAEAFAPARSRGPQLEMFGSPQTPPKRGKRNPDGESAAWSGLTLLVIAAGVAGGIYYLTKKTQTAALAAAGQTPAATAITSPPAVPTPKAGASTVFIDPNNTPESTIGKPTPPGGRPPSAKPMLFRRKGAAFRA